MRFFQYYFNLSNLAAENSQNLDQYVELLPSCQRNSNAALFSEYFIANFEGYIQDPICESPLLTLIH